MNPYEEPNLGSVHEPAQRIDIEWYAIAQAVGIFVLTYGAFYLLSLLVSLTELTIFSIMFGFASAAVPPFCGSIFLALRAKSNWALQGLIYAVTLSMVSLTLYAVVALFRQQFRLDFFLIQAAGYSMFATITTMAMMSLVKGLLWVFKSG